MEGKTTEFVSNVESRALCSRTVFLLVWRGVTDSVSRGNSPGKSRPTLWQLCLDVHGLGHHSLIYSFCWEKNPNILMSAMLISIYMSSTIYKDFFLPIHLCSGVRDTTPEWVKEEQLLNLSNTVLRQKNVWALASHLNSQRRGFLICKVRCLDHIKLSSKDCIQPHDAVAAILTPSLLESDSGGFSPTASPGLSSVAGQVKCLARPHGPPSPWPKHFNLQAWLHLSQELLVTVLFSTAVVIYNLLP